jgi:hypothetical protein
MKRSMRAFAVYLTALLLLDGTAQALAQRTIIDERFASLVAALSERGAPGGRAFGARGSP